MRKKIINLMIGIFLLIVLINIISALHSESCPAELENCFARAEEIITQKISCEKLTEEDLEILGDYYMEQMHPEELHEIMDERMGGEGSQQLKQVHINMGNMFYCGEQNVMPMNMMNMMMGRNYGMGMMSGYPSSYYNAANPIGFISTLLFFIIIIILALILIIFLIKSLNKKERRK